ncbi:MAG: hypothetical protein KAT58_10780 [candidate division Zixibacteria bacterium]|jgi:hypothetical protein|nr:hypothetical protein [candidate division Zixibacteria bacterium]
MTKQVIAEVVLRASDGSSILEAEEPITPETAKQYKIDEERMRQAREKLLAYGFQMVVAGPYSVSISGGKDAFERVFQTRLRVRHAVSEPGITAGAKTFYEAQDPIKIPEDLVFFVAAVTLPTPPELFP